MISGQAKNLRTDCAETMGTISPNLSKKIHTPLIVHLPATEAFCKAHIAGRGLGDEL